MLKPVVVKMTKGQVRHEFSQKVLRWVSGGGEEVRLGLKGETSICNQ